MARQRRSPSNVGLLFDWHAQQSRQTVVHLDRPFDIAPESGTVYAADALASAVGEVTGWLHAAGLTYGDRLAIVKDNHFDVLLIAAAAARIGALPVLISPVTKIDYLRTMLGRIDPKVLVVAPSVLARAVQVSMELVDSSCRIVVVGEPTKSDDVPDDGTESLPSNAVPLASLRGAEAQPVRIQPDDQPMIVTHTSGTTGVPKLVVHAASTSMATAPFKLESRRIPLVTSSPSDVVAGCFSFVHNRLLSWTAAQFNLTPKAVVAISEPSLDTVARMLEAHRPTSLEALPNMFQYWEELADLKPELFAQVKRFNSTFDAVHPRTVRKFLSISTSRFPVWATGLGQSEIAGISMNLFTRGTVRRWKDGQRDTTNVGWPPMVRVRVVDPETGRKQVKGKPGLLMVAGKARCLTYLGEDDRYQAKLVGKWWNSGDLGERGALGRIRMVDREVDLVPGMSCIELESTLLDRLERAAEVTVLGVAGERPVPVLCMRDDRLDPQEWTRATQGLPELAEPQLISWDEMPRTATWKVRRVELREKVLGTTETVGTGRWT